MASPSLQSNTTSTAGASLSDKGTLPSTTAGTCLVLSCFSDGAPTIVSPDSAGNVWTQVDSTNDAGRWSTLFICPSGVGTAGTLTVTVTYASTQNDVLTLIEYPASAGVHGHGNAIAGGVSGNPSVTLSAVSSGETCVALMVGAGTAQTAGLMAGGTADTVANLLSDILTEDGVSTGGTACTSTGTTTAWIGTALSLLAAGGPTISTQPATVQVASGSTASFSVAATASGGGTLSYQWLVNGVNVSTGTGGTTANYTTAALAYTDDGSNYSCTVTETGGTSPGAKSTIAAFVYVGTRVVGANTPVYTTSGGTSLAPSYSTLPTIAKGDQILLIVAQKPSSANSGSVTTPAGYTLISSLTGAGGYGATLGSGTGDTNLFIYYKTAGATGSESGTFTVTVGTNNESSATLLLLRPLAGATILYGAATGSDTTAGNVSVTVGSDPGEIPGDIAILTFNGASSLAIYSAEAVTTTGITYGPVTERAQPSTTTGNSIAGFIATTKALSGTSTAAPVFTATAGGTTTNARGPGIFVRMRATSAAVASPVKSFPAFNQRVPPFWPPARETWVPKILTIPVTATSTVAPAPQGDTSFATTTIIAAGFGAAPQADTSFATTVILPIGQLPPPPPLFGEFNRRVPPFWPPARETTLSTAITAAPGTVTSTLTIGPLAGTSFIGATLAASGFGAAPQADTAIAAGETATASISPTPQAATAINGAETAAASSAIAPQAATLLSASETAAAATNPAPQAGSSLVGAETATASSAATPQAATSLVGAETAGVAFSPAPTAASSIVGAELAATTTAAAPVATTSLIAGGSSAGAATSTPQAATALAGAETATAAASAAPQAATSVIGAEVAGTTLPAAPNASTALSGAEQATSALTATPAAGPALVGAEAAATTLAPTPQATTSLSAAELASGVLAPTPAAAMSAVGAERAASAIAAAPQATASVISSGGVGGAITPTPQAASSLAGAETAATAATAAPTGALVLTGAELAATALTPAPAASVAGAGASLDQSAIASTPSAAAAIAAAGAGGGSFPSTPQAASSVAGAESNSTTLTGAPAASTALSVGVRIASALAGNPDSALAGAAAELAKTSASASPQAAVSAASFTGTGGAIAATPAALSSVPTLTLLGCSFAFAPQSGLACAAASNAATAVVCSPAALLYWTTLVPFSAAPLARTWPCSPIDGSISSRTWPKA